ncbi:MAG: metal-dependent hydrolase [Thermoleophilia bacterium]|nr:metal-dependent hydrolase [Thermoleophilia bacterium]
MPAKLNAAITWIGHATFLIETAKGTRVLVDAFVDSCPTTPKSLVGEGLGDLDLILLTHGHGDHIADVAAHAKRTGAPVAGMVELMGWLDSKGGLSGHRLIDFNKGGTIHVAGIKVTMVDAKHSSSVPDGSYVGEPAGFVNELEDGYRIYFAGDTCVFGDMELIGDLYSPDLAVLPIGGHYTMDPVQAAKAVELLNVREVLGGHYGTFPPLTGRPAELRDLLELGGDTVTVHELEPGGVLRGATASA